MEEKKPRHHLETLKELIGDPGARRITETAQEGASQLGLYEQDIIECVQSLGREDFFKSMTTYIDYKIWQDVYKKNYKGIPIYLKLQIGQNGEGVVIAFKRDADK